MISDIQMNNPERDIYALSDIANLVRSTIQNSFRKPVWVKAEISEWKAGQRGHYYLQLVDKQYGIVQAQFKAMIWASFAQRIIPYFEATAGQRLTKGLTILFQGVLTYHPVFGLSIQIQYIDPEYTIGELAKEKAATINTLRREGLWDQNRELAVPIVPQRLAVISAPGSKGLSDFEKTLKKQCIGASVHITLFTSIMQGDNAEQSIIDSLNRIETDPSKFDAIAIIRGGGAEMDLKCFDELVLCRKVLDASLPVITGIGHTDDETICDLIAAVHRSTPTDAAIFICDEITAFLTRLNDAEKHISQIATTSINSTHIKLMELQHRLERSVNGELRFQNQRISGLSKTITSESVYVIRTSTKQLEILQTSLINRSKDIILKQKNTTILQPAFIHKIALKITEQISNNLLYHEKIVNLLHPKNILKRGYSITMANGKSITDINQVDEGVEITTQLFKGKLTSIITKK